MRHALRRLTFGLAVTAVSVSGLHADDKNQPERPVLPRLDASPLGAIKAPTLDQAREQAFAYLKSLPAGVSRMPAAQAIWSAGEGRTLLDRTVDTFCVAD